MTQNDETPQAPGRRETLVPYRRRPQLQRFLGLGAVIGLVLGAVIGYLGPDAPNSSLLQEVILLGAIGAVFGGFLGSVVYLVADRASLRG